jgi:predicted deacylase
MMKEMGIWTGDTKEVQPPIISTEGEVRFLSAMETGIFVSAIENTGTVEMGAHIGDIIDPIEGRILQHIESPIKGIVFTIRENPVVYKGALLARVYGGRN